MKQKQRSRNGSSNPRVAGDLSPAPYNPRIISDEQLDMLGNAMKEYGDLGGIVFNTRTGNCVGGHQRLRKIDPKWRIEKQPIKDKCGTVALGHIETPWGRFSYREVDWDEWKEKAANLAANKIGGEFDDDSLVQLLSALKDEKYDLSLTGFSTEEFKSMLESADQVVKNLSIDHRFEVIVECASEAEQQSIFNELTEAGRTVRLLTL